MGLFNKLKNALFEEEEINLDPTPEKVVVKEEPEKIVKPVVEPPKKEKVEEKPPVSVNKEHELFKTRNTFNFPDFDEDEFVTNYESTKPKETRTKRQENVEKKQPENMYYETKAKPTREKTNKRTSKQEKKVETTKKVFKPSPIISPVYGVLDKNYTKEDIIPAEKSIKNRKINDIDMARKKAFGSLEDEIEKTISDNPDNEFYNNNKSIDDLLTESVDDTIELSYGSREEKKSRKEKTPDFSNSIEEDLDRVDENLEAIDEEEEFVPPKRTSKAQEFDEEDTLENDLFDLIDSMYDNREEE